MTATEPKGSENPAMNDKVSDNPTNEHTRITTLRTFHIHGAEGSEHKQSMQFTVAYWDRSRSCVQDDRSRVEVTVSGGNGLKWSCRSSNTSTRVDRRSSRRRSVAAVEGTRSSGSRSSRGGVGVRMGATRHCPKEKGGRLGAEVVQLMFLVRMTSR